MPVRSRYRFLFSRLTASPIEAVTVLTEPAATEIGTELSDAVTIATEMVEC